VIDNLDTLKQELLDYLSSEGFAVFRAQPGLSDDKSVAWDTASHPNYESFLNAAKAAGARMVIFAHREFSLDELEEALEQAQECELPREEQRSLESGLAELRPNVGATCSIELGFNFEGRLYTYELVTDWYESYLELSELAMTATSSGEDDEDEADGFGGYYSKN
jgi:hypothetical protein